MKQFATFILALVTLNIGAQNSFTYKDDFKKILEKTKTPSDKLSYPGLLKKFQRNDTAMTSYEVLALMIGFTAKPDYKPYDDLEVERVIYKLNGDGKFKEALAMANTFLKTHPVSLKGLFEKSYAFHKLNQVDSAAYYLIQGKRIVKAMSFSGDGIEKPIFALGPTDGQDYVYKTARGKIGVMGSGSDKNGNFLDILEVIPKTGDPYKLYFIIQHATEKMFGGKSLEGELKEQKIKEKGK